MTKSNAIDPGRMMALCDYLSNLSGVFAFVRIEL